MKCIFTGLEADSDEHVIPRWLQARFGLADQTMYIPNGSQLRYKHHRVPADTQANNSFGVIEDRISRGILDPAEVYLWALKIHIGCIYRDASLRFDIKDPSSQFILDESDFTQEIWLFQQLFETWRNGGSTDPSPFGSVLFVDSLRTAPGFDFIHCLVTGTVAVDIGGKCILVFLWDQGDAMRANILEIWQRYHVPTVQALSGTPDFEDHCYIAHHVWACESAYWLYRNRRSLSLVKTSTRMVAVPPLSGRPAAKPADEKTYRQVCRNFGLDLLQYNGETNNHYCPFRPDTASSTNAAS